MTNYVLGGIAAGLIAPAIVGQFVDVVTLASARRARATVGRQR